MNFQVYSDFHLEFFRHQNAIDFIKDLPVLSDIVIIAGDLLNLNNITLADKIFDLLNSKWNNVFYVLGNHEYYGGDKSCKNKIRKKIESYNHITLLENDVIVNIGEYNILGNTLWWKDNPLNIIYRNYFNDYRQIKDLHNFVVKENIDTIEFLKNNINDKSIVVTHHMPSYQLVAKQYKGSELNRFFVCDMDDIMIDNKPLFWIYGHTHIPKDIVLYNTRTINNALGYYGETEDFDMNKLVEISS